VRLFGGLEVRTPEVGLVADSSWKKRKARMLFAMLVARRGQDVPRDVLFEYLWPEMDEDRARNNYYVVLSAIKRAMTGRAERGKAQYVRVNGSMCTVDTARVRSDLDDFDALVACANKAQQEGDADAVIGAYTALMDVYRGDLLPGDVYDDWFAPLRERYRQEFSDAMVRGSAILAERGDGKGALHMLRRALAFDPWREDIYQATLRCQIATGQRSAAVETYVACRARLAEDLGLDPSVETRRLYDTILAMEDDASLA
jgi:DNA-binding SARP family transcriptional activator